MEALTIHQPWAHLIMTGVKTVENRHWSTDYRGPLAIHAGARRGAERQGWLDEDLIDSLRSAGHSLPPLDQLIFSAVVAIVDLVDVVRYDPSPSLPGFVEPYALADDPFAQGPYCWILADPRPLDEPIPCPGKQGLWTPPSSLPTSDF